MRAGRLKAGFHRVGLALAGICAILASVALVLWLVLPNGREEFAVVTALLLALGPFCYLAAYAVGWIIAGFEGKRDSNSH